MKRELGLARCGLACCLCDEHENCLGCDANGCPGANDCRNLLCSKERGLKGCFECPDYPCDSPMLQKPRLRVFSELRKELGDETLLDLLALREQEGVVYHDAGQLTGDYDRPVSDAAIRQLVLHGKAAQNK